VSTILVADDNSNIQKMVTLALKDQGINVVAVGNGEAAIRKLPDVLPDLVLADIFMPVRNGYEVCEYVKQDTRFSHIPVILLVGAFDPLDEREAQRVGAEGVLKKPFVPPEPLITLVKSVLAKSASERLVAVAATHAPGVEGAPSPLAADSVEPVAPPVEMHEEGFASPLPRIEFGEREKPLAFGEMLQTPAVEVEPEPETDAQRETTLGEMPFWHGPATTEEPGTSEESFTWGGKQTLLPQRDDAEHLGPDDYGVEESVSDATESAGLPAEPSPEPSYSSFTGLHFEEPPAVSEPLANPPEDHFSSPAPVEASSAAVEAQAPDVYVEEAPAEAQSISGVAQTPPPSSFVSDYVQREASLPPAAVETLRSDAVRSFGVPQPPSAELVEAVVARVLERMQPQILDIVTREILKPVVEALVRRELEKN